MHRFVTGARWFLYKVPTAVQSGSSMSFSGNSARFHKDQKRIYVFMSDLKVYVPEKMKSKVYVPEKMAVRSLWFLLYLLMGFFLKH